MSPDPRVPLLTPDDAKAAATAAGLSDVAADLNVFRALLHHPEPARWLWDLLMGLLWHGSLDARLRELVIMRLGWATASDYEWTQHWRIARSLEVTEADLLGVRDWQAYDGFGPAERAVLAATDDTIATGAISASSWRACTEHVSADPRVLVELVAAIGVWRMISGMLRSIDIPLEEGVASWPPEGTGPA